MKSRAISIRKAEEIMKRKRNSKKRKRFSHSKNSFDDAAIRLTDTEYKVLEIMVREFMQPNKEYRYREGRRVLAEKMSCRMSIVSIALGGLMKKDWIRKIRSRGGDTFELCEDRVYWLEEAHGKEVQ